MSELLADMDCLIQMLHGIAGTDHALSKAQEIRAKLVGIDEQPGAEPDPAST